MPKQDCTLFAIYGLLMAGNVIAAALTFGNAPVLIGELARRAEGLADARLARSAPAERLAVAHFFARVDEGLAGRLTTAGFGICVDGRVRVHRKA